MFQTVLSFFTGDGKVWKIASIVLGVLLLTCSIYTGIKVVSLNGTIADRDKTITKKESDIKELQTSLISKRAEIEAQNAVIKSNTADKEKKEAEAKEAKVEVKERYKVIIKTIETFKEDKNATSCDNLGTFAHNLVW